MIKRENIRNIAIIAHVDHGKTTLVDAMLAQTAFNFTAEIGVSRCINDIYFNTLVVKRSILCKDCDTSFSFKVV